MEAIGRTGDTLTGIVTALIASGNDIDKAAVLAAQSNRLAGQYARPTPATQLLDINKHYKKKKGFSTYRKQRYCRG